MPVTLKMAIEQRGDAVHHGVVCSTGVTASLHDRDGTQASGVTKTAGLNRRFYCLGKCPRIFIHISPLIYEPQRN